MEHIISKFKVTNGEKFSLDDYDTSYSADYKKEDTDDILKKLIKKLQHCNLHYMLIIATLY